MKRAVFVAVWVALAGLAGPVAAQQIEARTRPPAPNQADTPPILLTYLAAVVLGGAVVVASLIPSKRGHQD